MGYSPALNQRLEMDFHYRMLEERQGRTTVNCREQEVQALHHLSFVFCVVSEMDKVGEKVCLKALWMKRLIVLVVSRDGGEGRATDSNF